MINGPARLRILDGVAEFSLGNWSDRIRSLQTGSSGTVALYRDAGFGGASAEFAPNTKASTMNPVLAGRVRSLTVSCTPKSQVSNHRVSQRFDDYRGDTGGSNGIHTSE